MKFSIMMKEGLFATAQRSPKLPFIAFESHIPALRQPVKRSAIHKTLQTLFLRRAPSIPRTLAFDCAAVHWSARLFL